MLDRFLNFFTSLRLTVACLVFAMVLVFVGTLAQVKLGLYVAQEQYFRSVFVWWSPQGASWKIPILPGGWLIGGVLLINLLAAHAKRFTLARKKIGIFIIHAGLILLLLGQFTTELFQVESFMRIEEGETRNFSESHRANELALVDKSDPKHDKVIAIPESFVTAKGEINHPELPFKLKVKEYYPNSSPMMSAPKDGALALTAPDGTGQRVWISNRSITAKMDDRNIPAATVEVVGKDGVVGTWLVANWLSDKALISAVARQFGPQWTGLVSPPQQFTYEGKTWQIDLRATRIYKPYEFTLIDFRHDRYLGTDKPKNFSSHISINNPQNGEKREANIYMNNPLRYGGETYYQGSFEPGDAVTVLQVVRNPAWLTPYLSCALVGLGLVVQFMMHLIDFMKKRKNEGSGKSGSAATVSKKTKAKAKPAVAEPAAVAASLSTVNRSKA